MAPEFSVILPTRGDSPHLRAALASALDGSPDLEVLLVHDRRRGEPVLPVDLAADRRVRVLEAASPGPAGSRNSGLDGARGRLVAFLDDDDAWLPGHLGRARETLGSRPEALLVATGAFELRDDTPDGSAPLPSVPGALPRFDPGLLAGEITLRDLLLANPILTPTVVLLRERLASGDRFDTGLSVMEDYDLWVRLADRHRLLFDPRPSVIVRRRPGSASRDLRGMAEGSLRILERARARGVPVRGTLGAQFRGRTGRLWHDLAYACLMEDDAAGARRAALRAAAHLPLNLKNYMYFLVGVLPGPLRRAVLARRKGARRGPLGLTPQSPR